MEEHIIKHTKSGNIVVKADDEGLCKLKDTGNGLIAKFPGYGGITQDYYVCLDYEQAECLYLALKEYQYESPVDNTSCEDMERVNISLTLPTLYQEEVTKAVTIDWGIIDSRYNYVAMDHDGCWYAYEDRPNGFTNECWEYHRTLFEQVDEAVDVSAPEDIYWKQSLFERPRK